MELNNLLIMDNVFDSETLTKLTEICQIELENPENNFLDKQGEDYVNQTQYRDINKRWYPPPNHYVTNLIRDFLYGEKLLKLTENLGDFAWICFNNRFTKTFELQVTEYLKNNKYDWHTDFELMRMRMLNYIFYLTEPEGGELQISNEVLNSFNFEKQEFNIYKSIKPKINRLVIMPSWLAHRVTPIISGKRLTVNGHINLQ